jgi:hypothetical protein
VFPSAAGFTTGNCVKATVSGTTLTFADQGSTCGGAGGSPGGSNTQVQFNDAGAFGGDADFAWDKTNNYLMVSGRYNTKNNGGTEIPLIYYEPALGYVCIQNCLGASENLVISGKSASPNTPLAVQMGTNQLQFRVTDHTIYLGTWAFGASNNYYTDTITVADKVGNDTALALIPNSSQSSSSAMFKIRNDDNTANALALSKSGIATTYNSVSTAGPGVVPVYGVISSTGQTASISTATLCGSASCTAGQYVIQAYMSSTATCATPGPGAVSIGLAWTDETGAKTATFPLSPNGSTTLGTTMGLGVNTNYATGTFNMYSAGSAAIQYSTTYTACTSGTGTYTIRLSAARVL